MHLSRCQLSVMPSVVEIDLYNICQKIPKTKKGLQCASLTIGKIIRKPTTLYENWQLLNTMFGLCGTLTMYRDRLTQIKKCNFYLG